MKTAIIILGHGSRNKSADEQIKRVAQEVRKSLSSAIVEYAFLQYAKPGAEEVVEKCIRLGSGKIVIVPFFLQLGTHVTAHIPELIGKTKKRHPDIDILATDYVGSHPLLTEVVLSLVNRGGGSN